MSFAPDTQPLAKPDALLRVPVGLASPLWGLFAGAAMSGAAWWWMTRWTRPRNLEALYATATPEPAAEPAMAALAAPVVEVLEALPPAIETVAEVAIQPAIEVVAETLVEPATQLVVEDTAEPVVEALSEAPALAQSALKVAVDDSVMVADAAAEVTKAAVARKPKPGTPKAV